MKAKKNAELLKQHGSAEAQAFDAKEPADLGVKIGSDYQAFLTRVKNAMTQECKDIENTLRMNKILLKTIESEIAAEEKRFK